MYRIFNLVNEINAVEHRLGEIYEYTGEEAYFWEQQISYAVIGKSCFVLADRLRTLGGLLERVVDEWEWDPVERMDKRKKRAKDERAQREARP
uniref:Uncharacterized protein n=1 Tax=Candidatus Kentrum sp. FW TaxID=2126338 RepID=A0A450SLX9_9GAMM|nr:MAG: hypothetical protein BECKFW1821B_GA0114236_10202 [Candidatus Kentron sp. FW]